MTTNSVRASYSWFNSKNYGYSLQIDDDIANYQNAIFSRYRIHIYNVNSEDTWWQRSRIETW